MAQTNSEKIDNNALAINSLQSDMKHLTETKCPMEEAKIENLELKIEQNQEDIELNEKEIAEVRNSVNLVAQEVKELILLKNKINNTLWKIVIGVFGSLLLYLLIQHGKEILSKISVLKPGM